MNTLEINQNLKSLKCFKGTYPIDRIKYFKTNRRPLAYVINLDEHYKPGSHWVACFIDSKNKAIYFDSFGSKKCPIRIKNILKLYKVKKMFCNPYMLQSLNSITCGAYTILFIKMLCNGFTFKEFLKIFSEKTVSNDKLVMRILI